MRHFSFASAACLLSDAATERAAAGFRRRAKKRQQRDAAGFARANDTGRAFM